LRPKRSVDAFWDHAAVIEIVEKEVFLPLLIAAGVVASAEKHAGAAAFT